MSRGSALGNGSHVSIPVIGQRLISNQHFCQLAKPNQDWKRSKHLEQYGGYQDYGHITYHAAQNPLRERRVRRFVISRPSKRLFPSFLGNTGRPNSLKRHPRAISRNATLSRNCVSQAKQITPPYKIYHLTDDYPQK
jgi:hypothetical protein